MLRPSKGDKKATKRAAQQVAAAERDQPQKKGSGTGGNKVLGAVETNLQEMAGKAAKVK